MKKKIVVRDKEHLMYLINKSLILDGVDTDLSHLDISRVTDLSYVFHASEFIGNISGWDTSNVTTMRGMFADPLSEIWSTIDFENWDTSKVEDMSFMFYKYPYGLPEGAEKFNTSNVKNMSHMLYEVNLEYTDLSGFDMSNVTNTSHMFQSSKNLYMEKPCEWDMSNVTDMSYMFDCCEDFNIDISGWNTSKVLYMLSMFYRAQINSDLSKWNTGKVETMSHMFYENRGYYGDISNWDTNSLVDISHMFAKSGKDNMPVCSGIENLNTSNIVYMDGVFYRTEFNPDVSRWDTSNVKDADHMFMESNFNQDVSGWNVSSLKTARLMFFKAENFNQNLDIWNLGKEVKKVDMFTETRLQSRGNLPIWFRDEDNDYE